eukprot:Em0018g1112a
MFPGVVKYIGDLDSPYLNGKLYVGAKLDDPVGEHDGRHKGKYFFRCPSMHGVIVAAEDVQLLHEPCGGMKPTAGNRCQACVEDSTGKPLFAPTCDEQKPDTPPSESATAETMPSGTGQVQSSPPQVGVANASVQSWQPFQSENVSAQESFTNKLVSNLPRSEASTPLPADTKLVDVNEFGEWVESWGGGLKGWSMAQTLQKLKDGQRRGEKEIKWQKTIEALEQEEEFGTQVQRINALRCELAKVRKRREESEKRIRLEAYETSNIQKALEELKEDTKITIDASKELVAKLKEYRNDDIFDGCIPTIEELK